MQNLSPRSRRPASLSLLAVLLVLMGLTAPFAAGCKGRKIDEISRVLASPDQFTDKEATVAGRVTRVFDPTQGLTRYAAYQLEDKSGKIWIISRAGAPSVGTEVGLKGRVRKDIREISGLLNAPFVNEILGTFLDESERRTR